MEKENFLCMFPTISSLMALLVVITAMIVAFILCGDSPVFCCFVAVSYMILAWTIGVAAGMKIKENEHKEGKP